MELFTTAHERTIDVDISTGAFWAQPFTEREKAFARLRAEAPVSWHPPTDWHEPHEQQGFWAVVRHADVAQVSRRSDIFGSRYGVMLDPLAPELSTPASFFLTMDAPEHTRYRRLVSAAFTPRAVAQLEERIADNARRIVDDLSGGGSFDFVHDCSMRLPMTTVSDIIGVPEADRARVALAAERLVGGADVPELPSMEAIFELLAGEMMYLFSVGSEMAAHHRKHPADDLMTNLVQAQEEGVGLTDDEIGACMVMMSVAGNDTTRNTTTHAMLALADFPDQREWLLADLPGRMGSAVEEFLRWGSAIQQFSRVALRDTELGGMKIAAGDKVGVFYCSSNRDESVFTDPMRLDLSRDPNPHHAFGGGGVHFCLGNGLARTQLRSILTELLTRLPRIEFGEPTRLGSNFVNGISQLPVTIG